MPRLAPSSRTTAWLVAPLLVGALLLGRPPVASAQTITSRSAGSTTWVPLMGYYDFGDQACCSGSGRYYGSYVVGQTFTTPSTASALESFSLWLGAANGSAPGSALHFQAYLMAWGGSAPTGAVLWRSGAYTGTDQAVFAGSTNGTRYDFLPGATLLPGQQYVLFLSANEQLETSHPGQYVLDRVEQRTVNSYAGGTSVSIPGTSGPASTLRSDDFYRSTTWTVGTTDLGFTAVFGSVSAGAITTPEPPSLALLGAGGVLTLGGLVRRRAGRA